MRCNLRAENTMALGCTTIGPDTNHQFSDGSHLKIQSDFMAASICMGTLRIARPILLIPRELRPFRCHRSDRHRSSFRRGFLSWGSTFGYGNTIGRSFRSCARRLGGRGAVRRRTVTPSVGHSTIETSKSATSCRILRNARHATHKRWSDARHAVRGAGSLH